QVAMIPTKELRKGIILEVCIDDQHPLIDQAQHISQGKHNERLTIASLRTCKQKDLSRHRLDFVAEFPQQGFKHLRIFHPILLAEVCANIEIATVDLV